MGLLLELEPTILRAGPLPDRPSARAPAARYWQAHLRLEAAATAKWTEADGFPLAGTYTGPQAVVENVFMRLGEFSDNWAVVVDRLVASFASACHGGRLR